MNIARITRQAKRLWASVVTGSLCYMEADKSAGRSNANPKVTYPEEKRKVIIGADVRLPSATFKQAERGTTSAWDIQVAIPVQLLPDGIHLKRGDRFSHEDTVYDVTRLRYDDTMKGFRLILIEGAYGD